MKIKKVVYSFLSIAFTFPSLTSAQTIIPPDLKDMPNASVYDILNSFMFWLLSIVGIVGIIGFAIAGILYLTSAGDEARIGTAKKAMLYSVIGIIVALSGLVVINFALGLLGAKSKF